MADSKVASLVPLVGTGEQEYPYRREGGSLKSLPPPPTASMPALSQP